MNTTIETRGEALRRLLQVARESGVRLLQDDRGEMWVTSASEPDVLHKVEPDRCSCRGFARAGHCRHQAALLSYLGFLDPEPPACTTCHDAGLIDAPRSRWVGGSQAGFRDQWSVEAPCPDCHPVAA